MLLQQQKQKQTVTERRGKEKEQKERNMNGNGHANGNGTMEKGTMAVKVCERKIPPLYDSNPTKYDESLVPRENERRNKCLPKFKART